MPFRKPHPPLAWALLLATCLLGCKREAEQPADPPSPQADAAVAVDTSAAPSAAAVESTPVKPAGTAPSTNPIPAVAAPATPPPAAAAPVPPPAPAKVAPLPAEVRRVVGRWVRPDGGYVLDLKSLADDGRLTAAYLNPRPIRISRAEARLEDGQTRVFVELTDENYPGCTYTLTYVPQADQLHGVYFQALMQESYEVHFVRETSAP